MGTRGARAATIQHTMVNVASAMGSLDYWGLYPNADYQEFEFSVPEWGFVLMDVEAGADPSIPLEEDQSRQ